MSKTVIKRRTRTQVKIDPYVSKRVDDSYVIVRDTKLVIENARKLLQHTLTNEFDESKLGLGSIVPGSDTGRSKSD